MTLTPVVSSNVAAVGHDPATSTLHVRFKSGKTYAYHGVPAEKHQALLSAASIGVHLNKFIKPGHRVTEIQESK